MFKFALSLTRPAHWRHVCQRLTSSVATLQQIDSGNKLKVVWKDGQEATYHARWLRHNCKCPECWESSSGQKVMPRKALQGPHMSVQSAAVNG